MSTTYVNKFNFTDPNDGQEYEVELRKDNVTGYYLAIDTRFLATPSNIVLSPFVLNETLDFNVEEPRAPVADMFDIIRWIRDYFYLNNTGQESGFGALVSNGTYLWSYGQIIAAKTTLGLIILDENLGNTVEIQRSIQRLRNRLDGLQGVTYDLFSTHIGTYDNIWDIPV